MAACHLARCSIEVMGWKSSISRSYKVTGRESNPYLPCLVVRPYHTASHTFLLFKRVSMETSGMSHCPKLSHLVLRPQSRKSLSLPFLNLPPRDLLPPSLASSLRCLTLSFSDFALGVSGAVSALTRLSPAGVEPATGGGEARLLWPLSYGLIQHRGYSFNHRRERDEIPPVLVATPGRTTGPG